MSFFKDVGDTQKCVKTDTPFDLALNDCLACSGCITKDEAGALAADLSFATDPTTETSFVISPQSKVNLFNIYRTDGMSYEAFETALCGFLRHKFNVARIVDTSSMRSRIYEETYREYLSTEHMIVSACPGTVTYIEKTAPHLVEYLSRVRSPQQMAFSLVHGSRTVSVMPCYDKKLENGRDGASFDHMLTTRDFHKVLGDLGFSGFVAQGTWMSGHLDPGSLETTQWNIGSSSGGYAEFVAGRDSEFSVRTVKRGVMEYILSSGGVISQITGLENSINYFKRSKTRGPMYKMAEIFLCQDSCIGGPGQVRDNDIEMDMDVYSRVGMETPAMSYRVDPEVRRVFRRVEVKRIDFRVEW